MALRGTSQCFWGRIAGGVSPKADFHRLHRATAHPKPGIILPIQGRVHHKHWLCDHWLGISDLSHHYQRREGDLTLLLKPIHPLRSFKYKTASILPKFLHPSFLHPLDYSRHVSYDHYWCQGRRNPRRHRPKPPRNL